MQTGTMKTRQLTGAEQRHLRAELERERRRFDRSDERYHVFAEALRRLDAGTYGRCFLCGNGIPYGRLSVMPETLHCVTCGRRA
jgi:DnaK suppressor protein